MDKSDGGWGKALFVDSFETGELVFPKVSVIGLLLFDSTARPGEPCHRDQPLRLRLSSGRARELAEALIAAADEAEGTGRQRQ